MIREVMFDHSTWNDAPWKFEAGTQNIAGAIGLGIAVDYLKGLGMARIQKHEQALTAYALEQLGKIPLLTMYGPHGTKERGCVISFTVEGIHPHDLSTLLDREGVEVRGGHHCAMPLMRILGVEGTVRASFALYTTHHDIDKLVASIAKAKGVFKV